MDDIICIKTLIEERQNATLDSIDELGRRTDKINSDISNLINSLQMLGNRQFAENRIREDSMLSGEDQRNGSNRSSSKQPEFSGTGEPLTLRSILLRAIQLVPDGSGEMDHESSGTVASIADNDCDEDATEACEEVDKPVSVNQPQSDSDEETQTQTQSHAQAVPEKKPAVSPPTKTKTPIDRDRIVDILKRYSLYDDDEDDDDDDDDDSE